MNKNQELLFFDMMSKVSTTSNATAKVLEQITENRGLRRQEEMLHLILTELKEQNAFLRRRYTPWTLLFYLPLIAGLLFSTFLAIVGRM